MKKNARVWSMDDYNAHTHAHALHFTSWRDSLVVFYCISAKKKKLGLDGKNINFPFYILAPKSKESILMVFNWIRYSVPFFDNKFNI